MKLQLVVIFALSTALLTSFQNCDKQGKFQSPSQSDSSSLSNGSSPISSSPFNFESGGQPYDGKPYINSDEKCADKTVISSRILVGNNKAYIVREHCQDITPKQIESDSITVSPDKGDLLNYNDQTYQHELGPIQIPLLTQFYTQLTGTLNSNTGAQVYIVDLFETPSSTIDLLKNLGIKVVCNFSAGTWESWRPDQANFPSEVMGNSAGSSQERYVDINSPIVRSIMLKRIDLAKSKGCLGVDMDNMDSFENKTGFNISTAQQIAYNSSLAYSAHDRMLFAGFHNTGQLVQSLVNSFDFAYVESCFKYNECNLFSPFVLNNKPLFNIEYSSLSSSMCELAKSQGISLSFQSRQLDGSGYNSCSNL